MTCYGSSGLCNDLSDSLVVQEIKSYPVNWFKLVEKLDEGAFHRKHMFQVVIIPSGPLVAEEDMGQVTLYLQAGVSGWGLTHYPLLEWDEWVGIWITQDEWMGIRS